MSIMTGPVKLFGPTVKVGLTNELVRIKQLPRREYTEAQVERLVEEMTNALKTPAGTMKLRPLQAVALYEMGTEGGLFAPLSVGSGKTLSGFLAPVVTFSQRPLLLIPAKLMAKTERDRGILAQHWRLPEFIRIMSYEWLGRVQAAEALHEYKPDLIIPDECHRLRNVRGAAVVRRVRRYLNDFPETKLVAMSGTITKRSLLDFAHIALWCLKNNCPVPRNFSDLELWADALDERKGQNKRAEPGALQVLCNEEEMQEWENDRRGTARRAFRRRLVETPGVVASSETLIDATLTLQAVEPAVHPSVDAAFEKLRDDMETPDGWPVMDGLGVFRHAREISLSFYYVWDPRPPPHWLQARKAWAAYVRQVLKHSRQLDSELQVRRAHQDSKELIAWDRVKNDFEPNTHAVWLDDGAINYCAEWAEREKGIVWTEHTCFGERLAEVSGLPYYGRQGLNARGEPIEAHQPGTPLIASIQSNGEGRNLQGWSTALITSMPANGSQVEQLLGRQHRPGQESDEVEFDVLVTCAEHVLAFWQAMRDCEYVQAATGSPQKLLLAGTNVPTVDELVFRSGSRWDKGRDE